MENSKSINEILGIGQMLDPQEVIRSGTNAKLLRDNPAFEEAVSKVYQDAIRAEDSITGDARMDQREANDARRAFSQLRVAIVALIEKLDDAIVAHEQEQADQATQEGIIYD